MKKAKAVKTSRIMEQPIDYKPSMTVKSSQMPAVKGMKIGSMIGMYVKGKVKGIMQDYDNPKVHRADIEIHGIKPIKKGFRKHIGGVVK